GFALPVFKHLRNSPGRLLRSSQAQLDGARAARRDREMVARSAFRADLIWIDGFVPPIDDEVVDSVLGICGSAAEQARLVGVVLGEEQRSRVGAMQMIL